MIAALFVQEGGAYYGIEGVDPWPESRDARLYPGPWPVVAHPPCSRWCRLAGLVEHRWGHKKGDDGRCFASALASVRIWGGVLEHPAFSDAWHTFGLPRPPSDGGWVRGLCGGWACQVEQWHYGHRARKATWLYAFGVADLPSLRWGSTPAEEATAYTTQETGRQRARRKARPEALASWCANHTAPDDDRPRLGKRAASATPPDFRDLLLSIARSARRSTEAA